MYISREEGREKESGKYIFKDLKFRLVEKKQMAFNLCSTKTSHLLDINTDMGSVIYFSVPEIPRMTVSKTLYVTPKI